ncbi:MAG: hypothetical protein ACR2JB_01230 [Bryobacteraceae bacterium]
MTTSAQVAANQANAQHSTGPKTPEGKAISCRNSFQHGLTGAFTVLPWEKQDEFDMLLANLRRPKAARTLSALPNHQRARLPQVPQ